MDNFSQPEAAGKNTGLGVQNSRNEKIAVIGAGISGLVAAHTLKNLGYTNITIFEALNRVGKLDEAAT